MLNSHDRSAESLRQHFEDEAARKRSEAERAKADELDRRARFEAARQHAKNIAAEARMRDPGIISWQGAVAAMFLLALIGGIFLIATYLGN